MKEQVNAKMKYNTGGGGKISQRLHHPLDLQRGGYSSSGGANSTLSVQ